jgi:arylsulfatase A-like enzyme
MRIIYVDIDSCRPDHLGSYGYQRPTSPVIDGLARHGLVARNCHTSDAPCLPSRAALFSGRLGVNNGVTCHNGPASQLRYAGGTHTHDPERPMWMRALQVAGWQTVCFSSFAQRHLAWWFSAGFTQFFGNQLAGGSELADEVTDKALDWLQRNGAIDNWFLHINYWDVHTPYKTPENYREKVRRGPPPTYPDRAQVALDADRWYGPRTSRDWWYQANWRNPGDPETRLMPDGGPDTWDRYLAFLDGYDAGIAYVDDCVGRLLEALERIGVRDETAIIVSADHGESIAELGLYFEHGNCCEGTTRVPLVIHWPGKTGGGRVLDRLMYQLDLPPTVLELLGMEIPAGWDGRSFAAAFDGNDDVGRSHLVVGTGIFSFQRAVRSQSHRMIRTIHSGLYPYDDLYLFDLAADPGQNVNLAATHPDVVAELDHVLLEWTYRYTTGPAGVRDPFQEQLRAGLSPDLYGPRELIERRLQELGRQDQLADLRRRRDLAPPLRPW